MNPQNLKILNIPMPVSYLNSAQSVKKLPDKIIFITITCILEYHEKSNY